MAQYYCHACAVKYGHLNSEAKTNINFTGSTYQLNKFFKHTVPPTSGSGIVSTFNDPAYEIYSDYVVNTMRSGSVEIDDFGRKNVFWYASQSQGVEYNNGIPQSTTDTIKVVLSDNPVKVHAFPINSNIIITENCCSCGTNVLTGSTTTEYR